MTQDDYPQALWGTLDWTKPTPLEIALRNALIDIANYSPASTIQPVAIARDTLKKLGIEYMQRTDRDAAPNKSEAAWHDIDSATPRDRFIIMWCREDDSYWWAKWQGGMWHGIDETGLTRDSENYSPDLWREIPKRIEPDASPANAEAVADELSEWKQAASVEAGLRREFLARAEKAEKRLAYMENKYGKIDWDA